MPVNQSGDHSTANIGTHNEFGTSQYNLTVNADSPTINVRLDGPHNKVTNKPDMKELKEILKPMTVTEQEANRPKCLKGTRVALLQRIRSWAESSDSPNIFLLTGGAGTGKSTVARTIAEEFEREGRLGCYIFFERDKTNSSTITNTVIRTIAYNLARKSSVIAGLLSVVVANDAESNFASTEITFKNVLRDPLLSAVEKGLYGPILIVLDALDECGSREARKDLTTLIREKISTLPSIFRFLITSRPGEGISPLPRASVSPFYNHSILDHTSASSKEDVIKFVRHEMRELRKDGGWHVPKDWPWEENMGVLGEAADGVFIWASTAVKYISGKKQGRFQYLKALVENSATVNKNLGGLYAAILKDSLEWDAIRKEQFSRIFSLILFGKRPLTVEEIDDLLELEAGTTRDLVFCLRSLVTYEEGEPIRIHHASLYDYLTSPESVDLGWHVDEDEQRNNIVLCCLEKMSKGLRFNICELETSFVMNKHVPELQDCIQNNISPSLQYACQNWSFHLRDVPYSEELSDSLHYFAYNSLLYWVEVLSLTGCLYNCLGPALEIAIKWLEIEVSRLSTSRNDIHIQLTRFISSIFAGTSKWADDKSSRLLSFLEDARNQLIKFNGPISQSTPHIYMTFLPLMKEESIFARHYAARFDGLTCVEYNGDKPKPACIKQIDVGSAISSVSFSPNGKRIVSGSDKNVCVWDVVSGGLVVGPFGGVSATFSGDGRYIASGNGYGTISVWNAATGKSIHGALEGHTELVKSVAFSPDSRYIASGSSDRTVQIWDAEKGVAIGGPLRGHSHEVLSVVFSPNGIHFASCSSSEIIVRDVESREMIYPPLESDSGISSIAFSYDSSKIVSGSLDGTIHIWNTSKGATLRKFSGGDVWGVYSLTSSPDGKHILLGSLGGVIRMWNAENSDTSPKLFKGHTNRVTSVSYSPDGTRFVSGSRDGTIRIWNIEGGQTESNLSEIKAMAVSVDGKYLVTGSQDSTINLWSVETGEILDGPFEGHSDRVTSLSFSPVSDEYCFASGSWDNTVRIWKLNGESIICHGHTDWVKSVCFSPDGRHIASGSWDRTIRVWDSQSGLQALKPFEGHTSWISSVCYSPDGTRIVSGSKDRTVRIWDSSDGNLLSTLGGHEYFVTSVACSHDGTLIFSGDDWRNILVWDAKSENLVHDLKNTADWMMSICFSPNNAWITSDSKDGYISWRNKLGDSLFLKSKLSSSINSIVSLPSTDSKYIKLASVSNDGLIRVWCLDLSSQEATWILRNDGWITGNGGNLLFWVPPDLRSTLIYGPCTRILNGQFSTKIILSENQGTRWAACYHPRPRRALYSSSS